MISPTLTGPWLSLTRELAWTPALVTVPRQVVQEVVEEDHPVEDPLVEVLLVVDPVGLGDRQRTFLTPASIITTATLTAPRPGPPLELMTRISVSSSATTTTGSPSTVSAGIVTA